MDNRAIRQAAASRRGKPVVRATMVVRGGRGPVVPVENLLDDVQETIKGLKSDPDAKQATKHLTTMVKHLNATQRGMFDASADWSRAMDAFRQFKGEIQDKGLEAKFDAAMKAMHAAGLGDKR